MRNKNVVRKNSLSYSEWLKSRDSYDPLSPDRIGESLNPFTTIPLTPLLEDMYEALERLYYSDSFKPRHKQIVKLLFKGITKHQDIAKRLGIKRITVTLMLQQIRKKLFKNINKFAV